MIIIIIVIIVIDERVSIWYFVDSCNIDNNDNNNMYYELRVYKHAHVNHTRKPGAIIYYYKYDVRVYVCVYVCILYNAMENDHF